MHIYYEESFFRANSKEEFIGFTEFLCNIQLCLAISNLSVNQNMCVQTANTGGLLGLFMGFSVVSIVEIVYFMSVRPYCASRRSKSKEVDTNIVTTISAANNDKNDSKENMYPYMN